MQHEVVSQDEWLIARNALLVDEKELTRARDRLSARRRELPWVKVEKKLRLRGARGQGQPRRLVRRAQPIGRQARHDGSGTEAPVRGLRVRIGPRRTPRSCISRIRRVVRRDRPRAARGDRALQETHGWRFTWVSSHGSDFSSDFGVPPGFRGGPVHTVFYRNPDGEIFHTYSAFGRGAEEVMTTT